MNLSKFFCFFSFKKRRAYPKILAAAFWLGAWQVVSLVISNQLVLVGPVELLAVLPEMLAKPRFLASVGNSFALITGGFLSAFAAGIILALLSFYARFAEALTRPLMSVIKSVPVASFIILLLFWAGSARLSYYTSFLVAVPITYENARKGLLTVNNDLLDVAKVFGANKFDEMRYLYLPGIKSYLSAASAISCGMCWKAGIAAEVIGQTSGTIGERLYYAKIWLSTAELFAATAVVVLLSFLFEKLFTFVLDRIKFW